MPTQIAAGDLAVLPYEGEDAVEAFAEAGDQALIDDGMIWELRHGERLVGVLQLSTVKHRVDLTEREHRDAILRGILAGSVSRIEVDGIPVTFVEGRDQIRYVWFGARAFAVLTLKGTQVDEEAILRELLGYQLASGSWDPLRADTNDA